MQRKYILTYLLVSLLPSLAAALAIWRLEPGQGRQGFVWVAFVVALAGSFGAEYLAKWLKRRLAGAIAEAVLLFNLVLMTFALITLSFNSAALLAFFLGGNRLLAWLLLLFGLVDSGLAAWSVLRTGQK
ncbi:MAG: hypothetical protein ACP5QG_07530 [candidate division WOR-3 bacterium]